MASMPTESELREFYQDVISDEHRQTLSVFKEGRSGLDVYILLYGRPVTWGCMYHHTAGWLICPGTIESRHFRLYLEQYRSDISESDKIALILKYS